MSFLNTPDDSPLYEADRARLGHVANYTRVFALAPDVYTAWRALGAATVAGLGRRRFELATVVAARRLGSRYCTLAHAAMLRDELGDEATVRAVLHGSLPATLDAADRAVVEYAEKIAADPASATPADIDALRAQGLSDTEIFHVALAVTIRRFFAGTLHAVGAEPDAELERAAGALLDDYS